MHMDHRLEALRAWLAGPLGAAEFALDPAAGDASFRRYLRVRTSGATVASGAATTLIAMDAPPPREDVRPWLAVASRLRAAGVHAPEVFAHDAEQGFVLMADLGDTTYQQALAAGVAPSALYPAALAALVRMQAHIPTTGLPPYDRPLLRRELELFREWACGRHLGLVLSAGEQAMLDATFTWLEDQALAMPQVFVHRDWHARNLMQVSAEGPGVLDFQDAVAGPVAYDLVSLTRDAYLDWSPGQIANWIATYHAAARAAGVPVPAAREELTRQHDLIGVQRHLKVVGIFCRLAHRDGKHAYLADIPRVLAHLRAVTPRHAELAGLDALLRARVMPGFGAARA